MYTAISSTLTRDRKANLTWLHWSHPGFWRHADEEVHCVNEAARGVSIRPIQISLQKLNIRRQATPPSPLPLSASASLCQPLQQLQCPSLQSSGAVCDTVFDANLSASMVVKQRNRKILNQLQSLMSSGISSSGTSSSSCKPARRSHTQVINSVRAVSLIESVL